MSKDNIQIQIDEINQKLDRVLGYIESQNQRTEQTNDLIKDLSIVGKEVYDNSVEELNNRDIEIDPNQLRDLGIKLVQNVPNFINLLGMLESLNDLVKDAGPIVNELIIDGTEKLGELDNKGYPEFLKELFGIIDNIITNFSKDEVKDLADNIVTILNTVKGLTQPEMLNSVNNAVKVYKHMEMDNIPEYSLFKLIREMNKPEMKKTLGFFITFMKNLSKDIN